MEFILYIQTFLTVILDKCTQFVKDLVGSLHNFYNFRNHYKHFKAFQILTFPNKNLHLLKSSNRYNATDSNFKYLARI